ncbi:MAG: DUF3348 family protein [Rubrivivax sp.]|nr:MAG: DUF3348 family protein [Rubrivivax sp.]
MARESRRTPLTGSAFIRSLAALSNVHAPASQDDFAQRVTQWFGWTHTFALSAALSDAPSPATEPGAAVRASADTDERECARVRAGLVALVTRTAAAAEPSADFTVHRRRYIACQQAMESQISPLRRRLRASLANGSPAQAKLAKLDSVMEEVIGAQERMLLTTVPGLLQPRFDQLRRAQGPAVQGDAAPQAPSPAGPWLDTFLQDMRALLLAELDLRLQAVEGLLAANRTPSSDRHE